MRAAVVIFTLAVVAVSMCQADPVAVPAAPGKLTQDQVIELVNAKYGEGVCWNLPCRRSCLAEGKPHGYCSVAGCVCVEPTPPDAAA